MRTWVCLVSLSGLLHCASGDGAGAGPPTGGASGEAPGETQNRADVPSDINERWVAVDREQAALTLEREGRDVFAARAEIMDALQIQTGQAIADVGAGSGLFTRLFAEAVGPSGRVYAIDIGPKMLAGIAEKAEADGHTQITTVLGTGTSTKLEPGSVDLAFVCDTYHHFEYPEAMLRSIRAALRPSGRLVVIDFEREEGASPSWILEHVRAGRKEVLQELERGGFRLVQTVALDALRENYFVVLQPAGPT